MRFSKRRLIVVFLLFILLDGCAAYLVPETKDPKDKLSWARSLINTGRPLPAEKLINESIEIYSRENNMAMLGEAYWLYGMLEYGFPKGNDKTKKTAIEYYEKALKYFNEYFTKVSYNNDDRYYANHYFDASSSAMYLGDSYEPENDRDKACKSNDLSIKYNKIGMEIKPNAKINVPKGFPNFKEFIISKQVKAKCLN